MSEKGRVLLLVREGANAPRMPNARRIELRGAPGDPEAPRPEDLLEEILAHDRVLVW